MGEASPTHDEWLRAAAVYSKRVASARQQTGRAAGQALVAVPVPVRLPAAPAPAAVAAAPMAVSLAASARAPIAVRPIAASAREASAREASAAARGAPRSSDELWDDLRDFRSVAGPPSNYVPPAPRTPSQLCVVHGAGRLEGRPDERMWSDVREGFKLSEGYQRIERICEHAKAIKVEKPWEPSWARAGERLSFEAFEAARLRREATEEEDWGRISGYIDRMKGRLETSALGTTAPGEDGAHSGASPVEGEPTLTPDAGVPMPPRSPRSGGRPPISLAHQRSLRAGGLATDAASVLASEGRAPTQPLESWPWRMPLPLESPFDQLRAERAEERRVRPFNASPPTYRGIWAEPIPAPPPPPTLEATVQATLVAEGEVGPNQRAIAARTAVAAGYQEWRSSGCAGVPPLSPTPVVALEVTGKRGDQLRPPQQQPHSPATPASATHGPGHATTGRLRFKAEISSRPQPAPAPSTASGHEGSALTTRKQAAARGANPESPPPGPWRVSRPSSGASSSRPCSRPGSGSLPPRPARTGGYLHGAGSRPASARGGGSRQSSRPTSAHRALAAAPEEVAADEATAAAPALNWQAAL